MLRRGYEAGAVWRAFEARSPIQSYLLEYVTFFYDPGLYCPYTVSLATAVPLHKYGSPAAKNAYLTPFLRRGGGLWQGATWMTEARGGSSARRSRPRPLPTATAEG
jgi:alkylation response protein AidB-like acyl-CoA dehydrogenase